jgi:hypothetical protein
MLSITASSTTRWRAVCIERCMHGSEGGVGMSSEEASRAYPTETPQWLRSLAIG